jgi:hypothetical protein
MEQTSLSACLLILKGVEPLGDLMKGFRHVLDTLAEILNHLARLLCLRIVRVCRST